MCNLFTKKYQKFVTFCLFFEISQKKIYMHFQTSKNSLEIKEGRLPGYLVDDCFFNQLVNNFLKLL